jgi:predicted amidophosphoribosyltransferase
MQTVACPNCQHANWPSARFCSSCGLELGTGVSGIIVDPSRLRKLCAGCRTVNDTEFRFCYNCGLALPDRVFVATQLVGDPAGFWIRTAAYLIDLTLLVVAGTLTTMLLTSRKLSLAQPNPGLSEAYSLKP